MNSYENRKGLIGYEQALSLAFENVRPMPEELCAIIDALGRVVSRDVKAVVNLPSRDSSLKDGYAVLSSDIQTAGPSNPVFLKLEGTCHAGQEFGLEVISGKAVRVLSGAPIPVGADAVLAEEFAEFESGIVRAYADSYVGRNILREGFDIRRGQKLVNQGELVTPPRAGLLAAGGISSVPVVRLPRVALLATGDEIITPGKPLGSGMVYASNVAMQEAWLRTLGINCRTEVSRDSLEQLTCMIDALINDSDILITSGGAWTGDRDLVIKALDCMDWSPIFHRIRMGPGKAVGMGLLRDKPVFCLPGGPPSNEMAFLMIALPAIAKIIGRKNHFMPTFIGTLSEDLTAQIDWTQFVHCDLRIVDGQYCLKPLEMRSRRLSAMGKTKALVKIPEGTEKLTAGTKVSFYASDIDFG